jgi:hypothetical protein
MWQLRAYCTCITGRPVNEQNIELTSQSSIRGVRVVNPNGNLKHQHLNIGTRKLTATQTSCMYLFEIHIQITTRRWLLMSLNAHARITTVVAPSMCLRLQRGLPCLTSSIARRLITFTYTPFSCHNTTNRSSRHRKEH